MPELLLQHQEHAQNVNGFFTGDPNKIVVNLEGDPDDEEAEQPDNAEEEAEENAPKPEID